MTDNGFKKVGKSGKRMYGPTKALACGFGADEREKFLAVLREKDVDLPVIFASAADGEKKLKSLLPEPAGSGTSGNDSMPRAVILSGITENQLHLILSGCRAAGLPETLWATLTPVSENWTLKDLLAELEKENAAMRKRRNSGAGGG